MRQWARAHVSDHAGLHYAGSVAVLAATGHTPQQLRLLADATTGLVPPSGTAAATARARAATGEDRGVSPTVCGQQVRKPEAAALPVLASSDGLLSSEESWANAGEWVEAWTLNQELRQRYPGHASLWHQRRLLCYAAHTAAAVLLVPPDSADTDAIMRVSLEGEKADATATQAEASANSKDPEEGGSGGKFSERERRQWAAEAHHAASYVRWLGCRFPGATVT